MHRAFFLEEILRVIFGCCYPERQPNRGYAAADLVALAGTCRFFKEPALDVLWTELKDEAPLARCLPGVCVSSSSELGCQSYRFKRRLNETERETVKSYTRRIRVLSIVYPCRFDLESLEDLCLPSNTDPLFTNIRKLWYSIVDQNLPFIHHIVSPQLKNLNLTFAVSDTSSCESFPGRNYGSTHSPLVEPSGGGLQHPYLGRRRASSSLQLAGLTVLSFTPTRELTNQVASSNQLLVFPALQRLSVHIERIVPISELLIHLRLPAIISVYTTFSAQSESPLRKFIRSFLMALRKVCTSQTTKSLTISHFAYLDPLVQSLGYVLTLEDIHPFSALNFTRIIFDLDWTVNLSDNDFLQIASMCPRLVSLVINENHGWRATGITPAGLAQFLQRCSFLEMFFIALDTRGYTSFAGIQTRDGASPMRRYTLVNIVDSIIEAESIPALADFFAENFPQLARGSHFFRSWESFMIRDHPDREVYMKRWQDVCALAKQKLLERSQ
ncbi:hypothetical protein OG21DRAFT_1486936 [Imleria badia]|nr:hypothetical protein OG21DRAFT_1486936 [Imleria badia]